MKILEQPLVKINTKNKKQRDFFLALISGLIGIVGKRTFRNLARYTQFTEHTFARQMSKTFDFIALNFALLEAALKPNKTLIAAQDATFISKAGKSTNGLGYFWNGSIGKTQKGLELDTIAVVAINDDDKEGYTISAEQVPASPKKADRKIEDPTKIDFAISHLKKVAQRLLQLGAFYIAVDAFYTKVKYVDGAIELGFHVVGKLRKDARLVRPLLAHKKLVVAEEKEVGSIKQEDFGPIVSSKITLNCKQSLYIAYLSNV